MTLVSPSFVSRRLPSLYGKTVPTLSDISLTFSCLRQLLSHSSGLTYALTIPLLRRYQEWRDCPSEGNGGDTMEENFLYPLTYDPGTGWGYGPNLDWTGRLIERATQMNLDEYMQKHICEPLGIVDMTFKLQRRPDMIERLSDMTKRDDETGRLCFEDLKYFHEDPRDCFGGQGVWTTPEEYFKILCSILFNDGKLLQRETRDLLFEPSLTRESESALHDQCFKYRDWHLAGPVPPQVQKTYGLGGLITEEDCDKKLWRRKGNLSWSGLPCIVWVRTDTRGFRCLRRLTFPKNIDSETGLCSLFVFHMKPWGDSTCFKLGRRFEEVMVALTKK